MKLLMKFDHLNAEKNFYCTRDYVTVLNKTDIDV